MLTSPPESITKEDVECLASDEDDSVIEILEDGEKIASSVIEITSTKGTVKTEVIQPCVIHTTIEYVQSLCNIYNIKVLRTKLQYSFCFIDIHKNNICILYLKYENGNRRV